MITIDGKTWARGWKDIAGMLEVHEDTVKRWETGGMPVEYDKFGKSWICLETAMRWLKQTERLSIALGT